MNYGVSTSELKNSAKLFSPGEIKSLGSVLVFAPHPDDESLACGGLIAILLSLNHPVHVIFLSDGSMSHPGSGKFPAAILSRLRAREALSALALLGVPAGQVFFLELKDGSLPHTDSPGFEQAVKTVSQHIKEIQPDTIVLPWRRDTHKDHRACWHLVNGALILSGRSVLALEYPLWLWERGTIEDLPQNDEMEIRSFDISPWLPIKEMAINKHQSQVTCMIDDDPKGFWLSPEVIAHFLVPQEIFLTGILPH